ncbi:hypothetical protein BLOT_005591 [Blomia tropicalis]|nr:hypothetical protein BLOT_005591 [Blomia tropicalis]
MGCAISKFHSHLSDISKHSQTVQGAVTISAHNLHTFLCPNNPQPKCIFIFGGSGSSKGEFIWDMFQHGLENFIHNQYNLAAKLLLHKNDLKLCVVKFSYHYIDVEKLIVDNLDTRIKKLCTTTNAQLVPVNLELPYSDSPDFMIKSPKRRRDDISEDLKSQLVLYANIITNSWILSLIKQEIEDNNFGTNEKIFIINLIPNRVTLFKNCLFLKQTPSFANFNFNYIAVNLVKHVSKRKDLEIKMDLFYDDINNNFINYFRLIDKLINVRVEEKPAKLQLKLSLSKDSVKVEDLPQLISFIYMPKKDQLEVNIFDFKFDEFDHVMANVKVRLTFVINDQIDLDEYTVLKLAQKINILHVRKFIYAYKMVRYSLNFE